MNKFLIIWLFVLPFSLAANRRGCSFPVMWFGEYFQVEYANPLRTLWVTNRTITEKGECVWNSGSQYVLKSEDSGQTCWRCLSIYRKHHNVLQYKESDCEYASQFSSESDLCNHIPGDGTMYSMFRRNAGATACPLKGPHMFTYAKGGTGQPCLDPKSYMDTCHDNTRMKLHYQACHDVKSSQSITEDWKCIASWVEGSHTYFVGELMEDFHLGDQGRFRCFVHDKDYKDGIVRMGVSVSATCNGLPSPTQGDKVFTMERVLGSDEKCLYPLWLLESHHTWQGISGRQRIHINTGHRSLRIVTESQDFQSQSEEHLICQSILPGETDKEQHTPVMNINRLTILDDHVSHGGSEYQKAIYVNSPSDITYETGKSGNLITINTANFGYQQQQKKLPYLQDNQQQRPGRDRLSLQQHHPASLMEPQVVKIVQHVKSGCESGYICSQFTRLGHNLMSLESGAMSKDPKIACRDHYFSNPKKAMYIAGSEAIACPLNGRYTFMLEQSRKPAFLEEKCSGSRKVQLSSGCGATHLRFECDRPGQANNVTQLNFQCHAHWTSNQESHLVVSLADNIGYYCLTYTENGMSLVAGDCQTDRPVQYRFSSTGPCIQALSATRSSAARSYTWTNTKIIFIFSSLFFYIFHQ